MSAPKILETIVDNGLTQVNLVEGVGKESKKPYKAIIIYIGEWSQMIFPKSKFEMDYIVKTLQENK